MSKRSEYYARWRAANPAKCLEYSRSYRRRLKEDRPEVYRERLNRRNDKLRKTRSARGFTNWTTRIGNKAIADFLHRHNLPMATFGRLCGYCGTAASTRIWTMVYGRKGGSEIRLPRRGTVERVLRATEALGEPINPVDWWPDLAAISCTSQRDDRCLYGSGVDPIVLEAQMEPAISPERRLLVEEAMAKMLDDRERKVMNMRMEGRTLDVVSDAIGRTRERVRQIQKQAMRKIREFVECE